MDARAFLAPYAEIAEQRQRAQRILGVPEGASRLALRRRFWELAREHHPDRGGAPEAFRRVVNAYLVLTRPDPRGYALEAAANDPSPAAPATEDEYWSWWLARFAP